MEAGVDDIGYTVSNIWACRVPCVCTCLCCCHLIMQSKQSYLPAATSPLLWVLIVTHQMDVLS